MDEKEIIRLYTLEKWTLRMIAEKMNSNHHMIKRVLSRNGILTSENHKTLKLYTDEHRRKVGLASVGRRTNLGKKMPKISLYKNMLAHIDYDITLDWLLVFDDIEKLKFLNKSISRGRDKKGFDTSVYIQFIEKFYYDDRFNLIYDKWIISKNKWMRPSLDHIHPKCNGGLCSVDNLQFLTWFENRTKMDMTHDEWESVKSNIKDYFL